jgi:hypothetical protein
MTFSTRSKPHERPTSLFAESTRARSAPIPRDAVVEVASDQQEATWLRVRKLALSNGGFSEDLGFDEDFSVRVGDCAIRAVIGEDHEPKDSIICAGIVVLWRPTRA